MNDYSALHTMASMLDQEQSPGPEESLTGAIDVNRTTSGRRPKCTRLDFRGTIVSSRAVGKHVAGALTFACSRSFYQDIETHGVDSGRRLFQNTSASRIPRAYSFNLVSRMGNGDVS